MGNNWISTASTVVNSVTSTWSPIGIWLSDWSKIVRLALHWIGLDDWQSGAKSLKCQSPKHGRRQFIGNPVPIQHKSISNWLAISSLFIPNPMPIHYQSLNWICNHLPIVHSHTIYSITHLSPLKVKSRLARIDTGHVNPNRRQSPI